jgi:aminoglycoside phosphotransferase (APT) family kinase protein
MQRAPFRIAGFGRLLGRLHARLHDLPGPMFPAQRERIIRNLNRSAFLPEERKASLLELLESLPGGEIVCHGDFHPENIILAESGPVIIDWEGCMHGNPAGDVAATCLWIRAVFTFRPGVAGWLMRRLGRRFERAYLAEYHRLAPGRIARLEEWVALLAACRMSEETRPEFDHLLRLIERAGIHGGVIDR